jgi:hypothetical protein
MLKLASTMKLAITEITLRALYDNLGLHLNG